MTARTVGPGAKRPTGVSSPQTARLLYSASKGKPPMRRCWSSGLAIVFAWIMVCGAALPLRAERALTPLDTPLADSILEQRLRFLESKLDASRTHGQIWYWSWMGIDVGSMVWLGIDAGLSEHEDDAVNSGVNAGLAAVGIADLLLRPLEARHGADPIGHLARANARAEDPQAARGRGPASPQRRAGGKPDLRGDARRQPRHKWGGRSDRRPRRETERRSHHVRRRHAGRYHKLC